MRILCTGDIHIGRRATRVPARANPGDLSAAQAWWDVVGLAIERRVDLVVLTGDVVDRDNRYFEAFGPLEQGIGALAAQGVPVVAVAGNHDFDVLPRLAESFKPDRFRLLGREERWERLTLAAGDQVVHLDGWSFPSERYPRDPLAAYDLPSPGDGVLLGVLHGDLDQPGSPYAPVEAADLRRLPASFWMLGHVHAPALHGEPGKAGILYPGSPLALSPKEPGPHGPWLLEVTSGGRVAARQVPLSRVRYEVLEVDVAGARGEDEVDRRLAEALRFRLGQVAPETGGALRHLVCRVRLTGRTPAHRRLEEHLRAAMEDLAVPHGSATATLDEVRVETRPMWDLAQLSGASGPPASLAGLLRGLRSPGADPVRQVLDRARQELETLASRLPYREIPRDELLADLAASDQDLAGEIERQGLLLLDELLAQKADGAAP
ncbi:DNA repair exonuclease [Limnochorda pilosa]|uniref:Calcineurin-like phosphoesterase domain-containing protein n=1 Tax=Limnochorda pilosa TaxID=1555112 RepID=A0A0K2SL88_LIMPI|nr:DNA repair exonuclease [Limnochorda pilosa]BAS27886.1 hypothetical protein LIP_2045 [Limnochorda pilosa]